MVFGKNGKVLGSSELSSMSATRPPDSHSYAKSRCWSRPGAVHWKGKYLNPAYRAHLKKSPQYSYFSLLFKQGPSESEFLIITRDIHDLEASFERQFEQCAIKTTQHNPIAGVQTDQTGFAAAAIPSEDEIWYGAVSDKSTCLKTLVVGHKMWDFFMFLGTFNVFLGIFFRIFLSYLSCVDTKEGIWYAGSFR